MRRFSLTVLLATLTVILSVYSAVFFFSISPPSDKAALYLGNKPRKKKTMEERAFFNQQRVMYEYDMVKDGGTGKLPMGMQERALAQAYRIPERERLQSGMSTLSPFAENAYTAAGPVNFGGRTRAVVFDKRFGTGGNQVMIAGAVSGGIFRSANGGNNWTLVTPENEIHNVTALAQDPRPGQENTWYAGGGEPIGNSASPSAGGAFFLGNGLFKSTNNGVSWERVSSTFEGSLEVFDAAFDIVHKILVHPVTGHVYVAGHRRLLRSTDNGSTFNVVFTGSQPASADNGQMDVVCTGTGRLYLAVNGGFADTQLRGLWYSDNGSLNSWTRIAGGQTINVDSIPGWRANSYTTSGAASLASKRIILALAPSNNNLLYAMYENGLSQAGANGSPEADLFKFDFTSSTYTNLSANMPNFPGQSDGIDPIALQGGYDMLLAVKPNDPNTVFVGGTNLYRSTNGFSSSTATAWIGGYKYWGPTATSFPVATYDNHHPDVHLLVFDPTNPNRALCATDGGMHITENISTSLSVTAPVNWTMINNYQTAQYYHLDLEHRATGNQVNNFIGGMQDNGSYLRVNGNNAHTRAGSGDGGAAAIGKFLSFSDYTLFVTSQLGTLVRLTPNNATTIEPTGLTPNSGGSGNGEFVTYFGFDNDNPEDLYYVNYNRLFRTTTATTVTNNSGWTELTGVASRTNSSNPGGDDIGIRAVSISNGPYTPSKTMYIGTTEGRVFRLNDPRNAAATTQPVDITPPDIRAMLSSARVNVGGIAIHPNNDNEIMVVYTNYQVTVGGNTRTDFNIWHTSNAKSSNPTWHLIEGNLNLPSIRSCAIVSRKDPVGAAYTDYYVGTSVGLYSCMNVRDSINASRPINWKREGGRILNYAVVTSLAYRPQDNLLLVGTHGNGMFYTNVPDPNYQPNVGTSVNEPIRNDRNFIEAAYPTITNNRLEYRIGNMVEVRELVIQVHSIGGQLVLKKTTGYQNGALNLSSLASGSYVLTITSNDYKHQFVKKIIKE